MTSKYFQNFLLFIWLLILFFGIVTSVVIFSQSSNFEKAIRENNKIITKLNAETKHLQKEIALLARYGNLISIANEADEFTKVQPPRHDQIVTFDKWVSGK